MRHDADILASGTILAPSGIFTQSLTVSGLPVSTAGGGGSALTVEEADGSPSVANVDTIVVSNDTLTDDGGGQVTITTGGTGGTTSGTFYMADAPPLLPTSFNDEFDDSNFNADSKWTLWDEDAALDNTTELEEGFVRLEANGVGGQGWIGYFQDAPIGVDFGLYAKVSYVGLNNLTSSPRVGIFFAEDLGANPATGNLYSLSLLHSTDTASSIEESEWTDFNSQGTTTSDASRQPGTWVYLRLAYDFSSGNLKASYSWDGTGWTQMATSAGSEAGGLGAVGGLLSKIGFGFIHTSASQIDVQWHFFRVQLGAAEFNRQAPLRGQNMPVPGSGSGGGGGGSNIDSVNAITSGDITIDGAGTVTVTTAGQAITVSGAESTGSSGEAISISGTSLSYFVPDAPPASGTTVNDEFDQNPTQELGAALGVPIDSKWTLFDVDGLINDTGNLAGIFADGFHMQTDDAGAANTIVAYHQDAPSASWQIVTKVGLSPAAGSGGTSISGDIRIGLFIGTDDIVSDAANADIITCSVRVHADNDIWSIGYEEWTDYNSVTTTRAALHQMEAVSLAAPEDNIVLPDGIYLKIGYRSSDGRVDVGYSLDGLAFTDLVASVTAHTLGTSVTKFGFFKTSSNLASSNPTAHFQFFRLNDIDGFFRDNPVYGRRIPVSGTVGAAGETGPQGPAGADGGGGGVANALVGADGITVTSGVDTDTITGFQTEFVNASGTLSTQITDDIATHTAIASAHHAKYTDAEAVTATESARFTMSGTLSTEIDDDITTHAAIANAHHDKYTDAEAISALEPTTSALAASGVATDANIVSVSGHLQSEIDAGGGGSGSTDISRVLLTTTSGITIPVATVVRVPWDKVLADTDNWFNASPNASVVTVPAGVTDVRVLGSVRFEGPAAPEQRRSITIHRNDANIPDTRVSVSIDPLTLPSSNETDFQVSTPTIPVTPGDTLSMIAFHNDSAGDLDLLGGSPSITWLSVEQVLVSGVGGGGVSDPLVLASGVFSESLTISGVPVSTGTGVLDHAALDNLDFASAGHTGFASEAELLTVSGHLQSEIDETSNFSGATLTTSGHDLGSSYIVTWTGAFYDTEGYFDPAEPTRLTVVGETITHVVVMSQGHINPSMTPAADGSPSYILNMNGALLFPDVRSKTLWPADGTNSRVDQFVSYPIPVTSGDYFEVNMNDASTGELAASRTWFSIEDATPRVGADGATGPQGPAGAGGGSVSNALIGADGITVTSGVSTDTLTGFRTEFVNASGTLQTQIDTNVTDIATNVTDIATNAAEILTVSGNLQTQIDTKGTLSNVVEDTTPQLGASLDAQSFDISSLNELTAVTGTFTSGLTVGGTSTRIDNEAITTGSGIFDELFLEGVQVFPPSSNVVDGFSGATMKLDAVQTVSNSTSHIVTWDSVVSDTEGWADLGADAQVFTVPEGIGVTHVKLYAQTTWEPNATSRRITQFQKNGSNTIEGTNIRFSQSAGTADEIGGLIASRQIPAVPGDEFSLLVFHSTGGDLDVRDSTGDFSTWFSIERANPIAVSGTEFTSISGSFTESLTVSGIPVSLGGGGVTDHAALSNLDFASAAHTGFASEAELLTVSGHLQGEIDATSSFSGALVAISGASQSITTGVATKLDYDHTEFDTDGYVIPGSGVVLEVPAGKGITHVKLNAQVMWSGDAASTDDRRRDLVFLKNFARLPAGNPEVRHPQQSNQVVIHQAHSSPLPVTAGDQFSVEVGHNAVGSLDANNSILRTWFSIEDVTPRVGADGATGPQGPAGEGGGSVANALIGADGITVSSGVSEDTLTGFRTEFVNASGTLQTDIDTKGTLSNVSEDTTPQLGGNLDAQSNDITSINALTAVTGTFTTGLTVGEGSTRIDNEAITTGSGVFDEIFLGGTQLSTNAVEGFRGALIAVSSGTTIPDATANISIPWDNVAYDTDGFFSLSAPDRFTIPAGINKIKLSAQIHWNGDAQGDRRLIMRKNEGGTADDDPENGQIVFLTDSATTLDAVDDYYQQGESPIISVVEGDFFQLRPRHGAGNDLSVDSSATWWQLEVLDPVASTPNDIAAISGSFTQSLTVSGIPVDITGGGATSEFSGALVALSGAVQSITTGVTSFVDFDHVEYDTDSFFTASSGQALTIPAGLGITHVVLRAQASWEGAAGTTDIRSINFRKLYKRIDFDMGVQQPHRANTTFIQQAVSPSIPVTAGDEFEFGVFQNSGGGIDIRNAVLATWFSIEVVGRE